MAVEGVMYVDSEYLPHDHLGNVITAIDAESGSVAQTLGFEAGGLVVRNTNGRLQPIGFADGLTDLDWQTEHFRNARLSIRVQPVGCEPIRPECRVGATDTRTLRTTRQTSLTLREQCLARIASLSFKERLRRLDKRIDEYLDAAKRAINAFTLKRE
ncbi:hypothetical protein BH09GEM1_BH09GEM1_40560 [soil metagenome]